MLADIRYWENDATNKHYAIAHFNVWNAEMGNAANLLI